MPNRINKAARRAVIRQGKEFIRRSLQADARDGLEADKGPIYIKDIVSNYADDINSLLKDTLSDTRWGRTHYYYGNRFITNPPDFSPTITKTKYRSFVDFSGNELVLRIRIYYFILDDDGKPHSLWHWRDLGVKETTFKKRTPIFGNPSTGQIGVYGVNSTRREIPGKGYSKKAVDSLSNKEDWIITKREDASVRNPLEKV